MIIICPCGEKKFEVDENLIPDKGRLLKCGSCDHTWFFNKNVSEQTDLLVDKPSKQKKILNKDEQIINASNQSITGFIKHKLYNQIPGATFDNLALSLIHI